MGPRRISLAVAMFAFPLSASAQPAAPPAVLAPYIQAKALRLLDLIDGAPEAKAAVSRDGELRALRAAYFKRLQATENCGKVAQCHLEPARLTKAEVVRVEARLRQLYRVSPALRQITDGPLAADGSTIGSAGLKGADLLAEAWQQTARSLDHMIATYGLGRPPLFPEIDAMSLDPASPAFADLVKATLSGIREDEIRPQPFFAPLRDLALLLLMMNGRDEAGRFEPLAEKENAAAVARIATIDWDRYRHAAILVPGSGLPNKELSGLAPFGLLRLHLAVKRFREGVAPIIIVSGGNVHPNKTPFNEAVEMKAALIRNYGVPEEAILIDPHARHTTTNVRNAARLAIHHGLPAEKALLIVSTAPQIDYIASAWFDDQSRLQAGGIGYRDRRRIAPFEIEFLPSRAALGRNPLDPLDP